MVTHSYSKQERPLSSSGRGAAEKQQNSHWLNVDGTNSESCKDFVTHNSNLLSHVYHPVNVYQILTTLTFPASILLPSEVENLNFPEYKTNTHAVNSDYYRMLFDEGQTEVPLESGPSLTLAQKQRFTICEISPEWGFSSESTKVIS